METRKRELVGKVVSDKTDKTIIVNVETYKDHPLYKKRVKYSKKYAAHDEKNEAKIGDTVRIVETRPLSRTKRFRLVEIVEKAIIL
ncbi:MAG: 30S ribosomal protein S17 [Bacilli bacterium]|nr:30S ribosomal protein S17 [Bacilli bacterium]